MMQLAVQQTPKKEQTRFLKRMAVHNRFIDKWLGLHNFVKFDLLVNMIAVKGISVTFHDWDDLQEVGVFILGV